MANRVVREGILDSEKINKLSWAGEIFYRRLMSKVDDFGRFDARVSILRAALYPLKLNNVSEADVQKWMDECSEAGAVSCYQVDNKPYIEIIDFNQSVRQKRSKFPPNAINCNQLQSIASNGIAESNPIQSNPDLNPKLKLIEIFFNDLPNSSEFERISMVLNLSKENLTKYVTPFRQAAELDYPSFKDFCNHFKNWVRKNPITEQPKTNKTNLAGR